MFLNDCLVSFAAVTCIKLLFLPLYKSTDFEVHRNWMAITHQKPIKEWYFENTSEWTLDYPPLFAWFEYILSVFAKYFDIYMLQITKMGYDSPQTVFFMRLSVIASDLVYFFSVNRLYNLVKNKGEKTNDPWNSSELILAMLLLWNPGLLLVDHIHFQYNGFLSGILLISIADMFEKKYVRSAFWFSILINLKHIYLYLAPAYFLYLLKNYCFKSHAFEVKNFSFVNFLKLSFIGISTVLLSFGPFIYMGQLNQVFSRLFPIKRGLTHSYWAPNAWALYNFCDLIVVYVARHFKLYPHGNINSCVTKGLVQECDSVILPTIHPIVCLLLTAIAMIPVVWIIFKKPGNSEAFIQSIVLCSFGSFLFGYHVHEKAILLIILPLTLTAVLKLEDAQTYSFLSVVGHFSLFPLLHMEGETPIKVLLLLLHAVYITSSLSRLHGIESSFFSSSEKLYFLGLVLLQILYSFGSIVLNLQEKFPFLCLMLISTYCAIGVAYSWFRYTYYTLNINRSFNKSKKRT